MNTRAFSGGTTLAWPAGMRKGSLWAALFMSAHAALACGSATDPIPATVNEVRPSDATCSAEGRLVFERKLETSEPHSDSALMLRGFDVTADAMHLLYVPYSTPCGRVVRSLDRVTGERRAEVRIDDACAFPEVPGGLVAVGGALYVRKGGDGKDGVFRSGDVGLVDVGPLPAGLWHLGEHQGRIVSADSRGNLKTIVPGESTATDFGAMALPPWGPSIGPEVDGDRIWMARNAFEAGMNHQVGFTRVGDRSKFCTFATENLPGLRGTRGDLFAAFEGRLYFAVPEAGVDGVAKLSIVELALRSDR